MTYTLAAQLALDCQNACNGSGLIHSLTEATEAICQESNRRNGCGTRWINQHPIVTMFLLKISELNGCGSSLHESYEPAENLCQRIASGEIEAY